MPFRGVSVKLRPEVDALSGNAVRLGLEDLDCSAAEDTVGGLVLRTPERFDETAMLAAGTNGTK